MRRDEDQLGARPDRRGEAGAALVAFALLATPLLLLLVGVVQLVLVVWGDATTRLAAAEGARLAVFCNDAEAADRREKVEARVREVLASAFGESRAFSDAVQLDLDGSQARGRVVALRVRYTHRFPVAFLQPYITELSLSATASAVADKEPAPGSRRPCSPVL